MYTSSALLVSTSRFRAAACGQGRVVEGDESLPLSGWPRGKGVTAVSWAVRHTPNATSLGKSDGGERDRTGLVSGTINTRRPPKRGKMNLGVPDLMKAYISGREAVLVGLFRVLVSTLRDSLGRQHSEDMVKSAVANVVNRMTLRAEKRPDPRLGDGALARELRDLCDRQMIKEAAAVVLILDVCAGSITDLDAGYSRLSEAERLVPDHFARIRARLDPRTADPSDVETMLAGMSSMLVQIAD